MTISLQATTGALAAGIFGDKMDSIIHFEIPTTDLRRAEAFYEHMFGWKINSVPQFKYTLVTTTPSGERGPLEPGAINGGMMLRQGEMQHPILVINVEDIDTHREKIQAAGGILIGEKIPVGDMGISAYFKDTEGNVLCLWQSLKK